jgi:hypothetical protein
MYLSIDYHNGKSRFEYTIESDNPPDGTIEKAVGAFLECVFTEKDNELTEYEFGSSDMPEDFPEFPDFLFSVEDHANNVEKAIREEEMREALYAIADEIVASRGENNG